MAQEIEIKKQNPELVSPLNLAFIGDSVFELIIRNKIISEYNGRPKIVNEKSKYYTRATTQSNMIMAIEDELSESEMRIYKRGRNAKSLSFPKSCTVSEYRHATGFETLIGWLYLSDETERLLEIIDKAIEKVS